MKTLKTFLSYHAALLLFAGCSMMLTACSDHDDDDTSVVEAVGDGTTGEDVLHGRLVFAIDADNMSQYKIPLSVFKDVLVETLDQSANYGFKLMGEGSNRYLVPYKKQDTPAGIEAIRIRVTPKAAPEEKRHAVVVFYKNHDDVTSRAGFSNDYSDIIGRTTYPNSALNVQQQVLLHMDRLKKIEYYEKQNESNEPITSVAFTRGRSKYVIANTGGAELPMGGLGQLDMYNNWIPIIDDIPGEELGPWWSRTEQGYNLWFKPQRTPLRIKSIKEIQQPKKWGEI